MPFIMKSVLSIQKITNLHGAMEAVRDKTARPSKCWKACINKCFCVTIHRKVCISNYVCTCAGKYRQEKCLDMSREDKYRTE